jgi:biopolymer transport protein ExbD
MVCVNKLRSSKGRSCDCAASKVSWHTPQKQLDAEQQKNRQQVSLTAVKMTAFGEQTREVLERLRENGFDLVEEMQPSIVD